MQLAEALHKALLHASEQDNQIAILRDVKTGECFCRVNNGAHNSSGEYVVEGVVFPSGDVRWSWNGKTRHEVHMPEAEEINSLIGDHYLNPNKKTTEVVYREAVKAVEERYGKGAVLCALRTFATRYYRPANGVKHDG